MGYYGQKVGATTVGNVTSGRTF